MFFPIHKTLGYSHGLILFAPFYEIGRLFFHPFVAHNLTALLVMECGIVCLYLLLRNFAALSFVEAFAVCAFFLTSQNVMNVGTSIWLQRASVFLIPPIVLLIAKTRGVVPAFFGGLLAALMLTQDFVTALLALLLIAIAAIPFLNLKERLTRNSTALSKAILIVASLATIWAICTIVFGGIDVHLFRLHIASDRWQRPIAIALALVFLVFIRGGFQISDRRFALAIAGGAIVGVLIFLWIYLPAYREHPVFPQKDLIDQLHQVTSATDLRAYDTLRPFVLALFVIALAWIPAFNVDRKARWIALWLALVSLFVFIAPFRFGTFSPWISLFERTPGFGAIRDPKRIIYLYELLIVFAVSWMMRRGRPAFGIAITIAACIVIVTRWNPETFEYHRRTEVFNEWVDAPIAIDSSCRSFFIRGASDVYMTRSSHLYALYGVDATFIALKTGVPSLNGYSAWVPNGWKIAHPQDPRYPGNVDEWIRRNRLTNVCALDIDQRTMQPYTPR